MRKAILRQRDPSIEGWALFLAVPEERLRAVDEVAWRREGRAAVVLSAHLCATCCPVYTDLS